MVKTVWECDDCGEKFNSRAARLYHRNHTCKAIKDKEELTEGKKEIGDNEPLKIEIGAESSEGNASGETTETTETGETREPIGKTSETIADEGRIGTGYTIVHDSDETADDEIPYILLVPLILLAALIAGILIFREKILEYFGGKKPKNGVMA